LKEGGGIGRTPQLSGEKKNRRPSAQGEEDVKTDSLCFPHGRALTGDRFVVEGGGGEKRKVVKWFRRSGEHLTTNGGKAMPCIFWHQ